MNRLLLSVSTACLMLASTSTPALAGNRATVVQNGSALIVQTTQDKGSNGKIEIDQTGFNNSIKLVQEDVDNGLDRGNGAATAAFVTQAGHDNKINPFATITTPLLGQRNAPGQQNLIVQIVQDGDHDLASFDQRGDGGSLNLFQHGHFNQAELAQYGTGNFVSISQAGENNGVRTTQTGDAGNLSVNQGGTNNQLAAKQFGFQDYADLHQSGTGNYAAINQYADSDEALLNQHGDNGLIVLQQTTANAMANLSQYGTGNSIISVQ